MLHHHSLSEKLAVVTGGAKGIGRAVAQVFIEAGAQVVVADRDATAGEAAAAQLAGGADGRAAFVALDVADSAAVAAVAETVVDRFGAPDILVNNAGIVHNAPATEVAADDWQRVIDVNLNGVFFTAQAFGRPMVAARRGAIVNISSICGSVPVFPQAQAAYNASKAGVNLLTKSLAIEWAPHGVRVNAVAPGYVATELTLAGRSKPEWFETWLRMTPMGRLAEPSEIAAAVLFLASDAASYVTGSVMMVDGGYSAM